MSIKLVKLRYKPICEFGKLEKGVSVTSAQLASLERGMRSRLEQNASRRSAGSEIAGQYRTR